jgi:hypothetical protein
MPSDLREGDRVRIVIDTVDPDMGFMGRWGRL